MNRYIKLTSHVTSVFFSPPTSSLESFAQYHLGTSNHPARTHFKTCFCSITMSSDSMQETPKRRKGKAPTLRDSDWVPHKEHIAELCLSGVLPVELQRIMDVNYGFKAGYVLAFGCETGKHNWQPIRVRQYTYRLRQWGLDRNVNRKEMKAIIRKRQYRKLAEKENPTLSFMCVVLRWTHKKSNAGWTRIMYRRTSSTRLMSGNIVRMVVKNHITCHRLLYKP